MPFEFSEINPMPTEDIVCNFNELRQDVVLLYELKLALANCEYELQTLRHRFETLAPGKVRTCSLQTPQGKEKSLDQHHVVMWSVVN